MFARKATPDRSTKGDHVPYRYVVLHEELPNRPARPVGLAIERNGFVRVETRDDLCMPRRYSEPFVVAGPDMTTIAYTADDPRYFDQVLIDLSRTFTLAEPGVTMDTSESAFRKLLLEKVLRPLRYAESHQYATIQSYHAECGYAYETTQASEGATSHDRVSSRGSVLVA
jgi:hypothetical protein